MTIGDYQNILKYLTNADIFDFAQRLCEANGFDPIKTYPQTVGSVVMQSPARRQLYMNSIFNTIRTALFIGSTKEEMIRLASYLMVLSKSTDNSLDYTKCAIDMDIPELKKKYNKEEYFAINASFDELKQVIEVRDKDFYGVVIKNENS